MTKGSRIRNLRESFDISQVEMAARIGVSKQTLYKYENDIITNIPSDKVEAIAAALHSTPAFIMGWNESSDTAAADPLSSDERALLSDYQKLNELGKEKARIDVADLTEIPKYTEKERSDSGVMAG